MNTFKAIITVAICFFCFSFAANAGITRVHGNEKTLNYEDSAKINKLLEEAKSYELIKDYEKAVAAALNAADIAEKSNFEYGKYKAYRALESLYKQAGKPLTAAKYKVKALKSQSRLEEINYAENEKAMIEKQEKEEMIRKQQVLLEQEQQELKRRMDEIEKLNNDKTISKEELERRKLEIQQKQFEIEKKKQTISIQEQQLTTTSTKLNLTIQELQTQKLQAKVFEDSLQITKKNEELAKNEVEKQSLINYLLGLGLSVLLILAASFYRMYTIKRRTQDLLMQKNNEIALEKKRSDDLLLNILPQEVAEELKAKGKSEPKFFEKATVMFTDFKDFTRISEMITPKQLVEDIDFIFREFDAITERHNLEKIKTIGDAYLCVSGLPDATSHSPMNMVKAAMEIHEFISNLIKEKQNDKQPYFDIRIGIHTGPIVAGIVGNKKFAFDIWGDTVNTAARMEQNCVAGKINVSGNTFEEIKDQVEYEYRGKVEAKNKGQIDMYYINRIIEN